MGRKANCFCRMLRVVETYGDYAAMCQYDKGWCYAAEPEDGLLRNWVIVHPERCEQHKKDSKWYGSPYKVTVDKLDKDNFVTTTVFKYELSADFGPLDHLFEQWKESGYIYDYRIGIWQESDEHLPHKVVRMNDSGYEIWEI